MKKIYALVLFLQTAMIATATIHTITVQNFQFSPNTVNAVCNDTIQWQWISGSHTTTSASIPAGAAVWNSTIDASTTTFMYKITVAGNYGYVCTPHASMGMAGAIVVTCPNGVSNIENNYVSSAYPNPFFNKVTIETMDADMIALYNIVGEKIKTIDLQRGQTKTEINLADIRKGIYFYCILKEGTVIETRKIVKR